MWILFWRTKWSSKTSGPVITGVLIGLFVSFVLRRLSYPTSCVYVGPKLSSPAPVEVDQLQHIQRVQPSSPHLRLQSPSRKELLLVGVMTAAKYVKSRGRSTYKTWGQDVPGKILYFTGSNSSVSVDAKIVPVPLVMLPGVDDSYPPQKKSFMMLKYMFEHYGDKFEWFLRADDDVYIRMDQLSKLLRFLDSSKMHFIGQAGLGTGFERGKLHLGPHENFCMGGPGIIFSRPTLAKLVPEIDTCLANVRSSHEDVELGRCVSRTTGLSCTWSYEMRTLFHHSTSGPWQSFKNHKYRNAITMHPLKNHASLYQIHSHFLALKVQELAYEMIRLDRDLYSMGFYSEMINTTGLMPSLTKFSPPNASDFLGWDFLSDTKSLFTHRSANPKSRPGTATREVLRNTVHELMDIVNNVAKGRNRTAEMNKMLYGYHRVNPLYGEDFIFDLLMNYRDYNSGNPMVQPVRRHAYIQRPFGPVQLRIKQHSSRKSDFKASKTNVMIVVPLAGRLTTFERFLHNFQDTWQNLKGEIGLKLVIVQLRQSEAEEGGLRNLIKKLSDSPSVNLVSLEEEFSRGLALDHGISKCSKDDLIFVLDVDFVFSPQVIRKVVLNTVKHERVYFPIIFSQYDPRFRDDENEHELTVSDHNGYWRVDGYGVAAFYKSDYDRVGGYDLSIRGWGKEDVLLFDRFVGSNLAAFRAPDPELVHLYHEITCDKKLSQVQYEMCLGSQATTSGSSLSLMKYAFDNRRGIKRLGIVARILFNSSSNAFEN